MSGIFNSLTAWDIRAMEFINLNLHSPLLSAVMPWFDNGRAWALPLGALWLGVTIFGNARLRWLGLGALVLLAVTDPVSSRLLKPLVGRIRPCNVLAGLNLWKDGTWMIIPDPVLEIYKSSYSFPSSHAANSGAQALWWGRVFPKWRPVFLTFAFIIGLSRVYDGVHWPGDVLGGWAVAAAAYALLVFAERRIPHSFGRRGVR